jgi:hypothetical protein
MVTRLVRQTLIQEKTVMENANRVPQTHLLLTIRVMHTDQIVGSTHINGSIIKLQTVLVEPKK